MSKRGKREQMVKIWKERKHGTSARQRKKSKKKMRKNSENVRSNAKKRG